MTPGSRWPETRAAHGLVATPHARASAAGVAALRRGGNALDAAVAAATTIAVVYPHMNSIGGDNVWLLYDAGRARLRALLGIGRAAAAATPDRYRRRGPIMPVRGGAAALTVPGAVSGWWEAHVYSRDVMGSPVPWRALFEDAIAHARDGIPPSAGQRRVSAHARDLFGDDADPAVRRTLWPVYHRDRLLAERFVQTDLAVTLGRVAAGGADEFYRGTLAARIAAGAAETGSPLAASDFAAHRAEWADPLRVRYRGGEAVSAPPPTQGVAALALLALIEGFDVAALDDADYVHLVVEATKLALEDRDHYLADPVFAEVPVTHCLDPGRLRTRRARLSRHAVAAPDTRAAGGDTVAIVTADATGSAVAVIQSLYHEFGAGVVAGDTGVLLQNRGAFFSLDERHPNCLAPGKRPAHTLIPSMYLISGRPRLVYGTMGGDGQPQTQAALVTRVVDRGLGPQAAIEAPRWLFGRTWGDVSRSLRLEGRFPAGVAADLRRRGHEVQSVEDWSDVVGHAQMIRLDADGLTGGSDPRADGAALGW